MLLSCEDALERILEGVQPLEGETVPLQDAAGRAAARAVHARQALPAWDNSAKDGYAVAAADLASLGGVARSRPTSGLSLPVVAECSPGELPAAPLQRGTVVRIMTGAPLPHGADAVVPVENANARAGSGRFAAVGESVTFFAAPAPGENVRPAAADVAPEDRVLEPGQTLTPERIALLAALGEHGVEVVRRPRIAILPTGDELVEQGREAPPGRLYSSNGPALAALARQAGALPRLLGVVPDDRLLIRAAVFEALDSHEVVVTSGGVSAGAHDHVRGVLEEAAGGLVFWKVRMRPGEPLVFARTADLPGIGRVSPRSLFGLPGNPTSALVTFLEFVRPLVRRLAGFSDVFLPTVQAVLGRTVRVEPERLSFVRVRLTRGADGALVAVPSGGQGSGLLRPLADADGLLIAGPACELREGEAATVQLLHGLPPPSAPFSL